MAGALAHSGRPAESAPRHLPVGACGSGWYHEAAMQEEAERTRKS